MMPLEEKVLIVVPCFNEASRLNTVSFKAWVEMNPSMDLLFVNDGSTDYTQPVLEQMAADLPERIFCLQLPKNLGKAEAVRQGFQFIFQKISQPYLYLAYVDADLATPLSEIKYLLDYAAFRGNNKQFIFGSRLKVLGSHIDRNPLRHYFGRISATGASISLGLPVYDTQCGIKIFHRNICQTIFSDPFMSRWLFDVEIFFRFKALFTKAEFDEAVLEVPLRSWNEIPGTKIKFSDILKVPFELWRINKKYAQTSRF